jgi:hypothetical protein
MLPTSAIAFLAFLGEASAASLMPQQLCGEGPQRVCFGRDGGVSQNILEDDVKYVANYLRLIARQNEGDGLAAMWTMESVSPGVDCQEWTLPISGSGTVLALAKHINPRINSSVLYEDLANTIDGGVNASEKDKASSMLGCGTSGGMIGVKADPKNPEYATADYKARKYKPEGILIKLVRAPEIVDVEEEVD